MTQKEINKEQLLKDLLQLDQMAELCDIVNIGSNTYKIQSVNLFGENYDLQEYGESYPENLKAFLEDNIDDLMSLDDVGINVVSEDCNNEYEEDDFISFVELATEYKGSVQFKKYKTLFEV